MVESLTDNSEITSLNPTGDNFLLRKNFNTCKFNLLILVFLRENPRSQQS